MQARLRDRSVRRGRLLPFAAALALVGVVPATGGAGATVPAPAVDQEPFLCTTEQAGLGQPIVDNDERRGTPVYPVGDDGAPDRTADPLGWSERCQVEPRVDYFYRTGGGSLRPIPDGATEIPADAAWLPVADLVGAEDMDLGDATEIPYLIRYQRGTLPQERFLYSLAMLVPWDEIAGEVVSIPSPDGGPPDPLLRSHWNGRLLYSFDGGVGIGHSQGGLSNSGGMFDEALRLGHAVVASSGTRTSIHYNLLRGGRAAVEAKARFVAEHGEPRYTVGIGGSGGGIQQYVYGQNQPDLIDAAIPLYAYPDMTTQTIHTGDCELLEHYMDVLDADNPRWRDWDERKLLQGLNSIHGFTSTWQGRTGADGSVECVEGWRGLTPLAMNPTLGFPTGLDRVLLDPVFFAEILGKIAAGQPPVPDDFPDVARYLRVDEDPDRWVEWTHWDDVREVYGTDPATGLARVPWDNVGVQYGLRAVANGTITPTEFLDLNARIGSWNDPEDAVPESCGFVDTLLGSELSVLARAIGACEGDELDAYSSRQMTFSTDPSEPAPRREGDIDAIRGAWEHGLVFDGTLPRQIPVIDARHYLEHRLDMHNVHQSFAARERIRRAQGHADNHLVWFLDARPSIDQAATTTLLQDGFRTVDEWMANIEAHPTGDVVASKPAAAVDTCWDTDGTLIAAGDDVWAGAVDLIESGEGAWTDAAPEAVGGTAVGPCAGHFPLHSTSRIVAGAPVTGDVYKCQTKTVAQAIADGDYGEWTPTPEEQAWLEEIFPTGVCDYDRPGVGAPDGPMEPNDPTEPTPPDTADFFGLAARAVGAGGTTVYAAAGFLLDGDVAIEHGHTGRVRSVAGAGTIPGLCGPATFDLDVRALFLGIYRQDLTMTDCGATGVGTAVTAAVPLGPEAVVGLGAGISFSFGPQRYQLVWLAADRR